jgi:hypothetical protein
MNPALMPHVFIMLVYCTPGAHTCRVEWGQGAYPTLEECVQVAPAWVATTNWFDKRKVTGAFCELAGRAPAPYTITRRELQSAICGQQEKRCGTRSQTQADATEDP